MGSTKFLFEKLKIQSLVNPAAKFAALFTARASATHPSTDIILDNDSLSSKDDVRSWTLADWLTIGRTEGIDMDEYDQPACFSVTNTKIYNIRTGIGFMGSNSVFANNSIDNFGDDGLDYAANNLIITHNSITNNNTLGDANHNDCMRGQIGRGTSYKNILIDSNICIAQTSAALKYLGDLEGIDAFDSDWYNVNVTNNVGIVTNYQGISYGSLHGGLIANNTVLAENPSKGTWISISDKSHEGSISDHVTIRNNISTTLGVGATGTTIVADHNLVGDSMSFFNQTTQKTDYYSFKNNAGQLIGNNNRFDKNDGGFNQVFLAYDPAHYNFNLNLLTPASPSATTGDPAVGAGSSVEAPTLDITGAARTLPVDLGAYKAVSQKPYTATLTLTATARQTGAPLFSSLLSMEKLLAPLQSQPTSIKDM